MDFLKEDFVSYGCMSDNLPDCERSKRPFYITTAIAYTNGFPHMGHAYEFLSADALARYHRVLGCDTYFVTGTDEHGQKVANSAETAGVTPLSHCDKYVDSFKTLQRRLLMSYSDFVRTTDGSHALTAQNLWCRCANSGDIYLSAYEGWYNEREEVFVADTEAEANGFKDPGNGLPLKRVKEDSYFFRMSRFTEQLIQHIEVDCPNFIQPDTHKQVILGRLKKDGLRDLSVSRTSFSWGIPVPEGFDPRHVMYVWFDALSNYLTGVHALDEEPHPLASYWPAQRHIIGKDIVWFHCVIWPCILLSANIPLPESVFSHGFVNAADGRKMSKSYNNTVDPHEILNKYSVDSFRYYMCASVTYGADLSFSESFLVTMHNSELADILGNLVHRALTLCQKYCDGKVPDTLHDERLSQLLPFDLLALKQGVEEDMKSCAIHSAIFKAMDAARATNRYLTEAEPWKMKGENEVRRAPIVRTTLEAIYAFAHFLAPVMPQAAQTIFQCLNTPPRCAPNLRDDMYNLTPGTRVDLGNILFQKIEVAAPAETVSAVPAVGKAGGKGKAPASVAEALKNGDDVEHISEFSKVEIRVGLITKVWNHPTAERLYCEEIDVGAQAGGLRQVASGLRQFYSAEQMLGRKVLVVCNLKESKFQGFMSQGMVLAAKSAEGDKVELVSPPEGSAVGERIFATAPSESGQQQLPAEQPLPFSAAKMKKDKVWESFARGLRTDSQGVVCWISQSVKDSGSEVLHLSSTGGPCTVPTLADAIVS